MQLNFITVDVFTDQQFGGNPLAVVLNGHGLTTEQMQSIAAEFNLAETTFVLPPKGPHHAAEVRIFTPRAELPFAGHPNIGTAFVLATLGNPYGSIISDSLVFEEKAGLVKLDLIRNGTSIIGARLAAPQPLVRSEDIAPDVVATACSIGVSDIETANHCPFRKRHPEITLHYTRFKFPVLAFKFPVPSQKFPVPLSREFRSKSAESLDEWQPLSRNPTQN